MGGASKSKRVRIPTVLQMEAAECGAASLAMILSFYGRYVPLEELRSECSVSRDGSNALNLLKVAEKYNLFAEGKKKEAEELFDVPLPAILFWEHKHFLVLEGFGKNKVYLNDPAAGRRMVSHLEFKKSYSGIVLTFQKTEQFFPGGKKPLSFFQQFFSYFKDLLQPLVFLLLVHFCLLLPGFAFPAFLMIFVNKYYSRYLPFPWESEFLYAVFFAVLFVAILNWIQFYFFSRIHRKLSMKLSGRFLWHLFRLPMNFYTQRMSSQIAYWMTLNQRVAEVLTGPVMSSLMHLLFVFFYALAMFAYDSAIAWVGLSVGIINLTTLCLIFRSKVDMYELFRFDLIRNIGDWISGLFSIDSIKAKGLESAFFSKWSDNFAKYINVSQTIEKKEVLLWVLPIFFQALAFAFLLGFGALRIIEGSLTIGKLMALQILQIHFLVPIYRFVELSPVIQELKKDMQYLDDVLKNDVDRFYKWEKTKKTDVKKIKLYGSLEFRDVTFHYSSCSLPAVKNISCTIRPGQKIAIVGMTGSGKSTVAKLAAGLYYPHSGQILYDGIPLEEIPTDLFRNSISFVDQDIFLFSGTIRDNLTLWNDEIPDEMILSATNDASIHEEISIRTGGYDSELLEEGKNLSGGQRQQLEIARALLYNPSLLILDKATCNLDAQTERIISKKIRQRGCSLLVVADRLSSIQDCDEVLVLDEGMIVQRGTHEQLKTAEGIYRQFVKSEGRNE
jgi:ATP-binding cassette, subfamily C, bacterial